MKKENLISKWLDNNLNDEEKEAFDKLDASVSYRKISEAVKAFAAPEIDTEDSYQRLSKKLTFQKKTSSNLRYISTLVAAVVVVALSVYLFNNSSAQDFQAGVGDSLAVMLPDASEVTLNAGSTLSVNEGSWNKAREVKLKGEAFFDVQTGSTFSVITDQGTVTVLGTEFNVIERDHYFEVACYEGKVAVETMDSEYTLQVGDVIRVFDGRIQLISTSFSKPSWLDEKSIFKSMPIVEVLDELERQYGINITGELRDSKSPFTGNVTHKNLEMALQAVTIPLNLTYTITGDKVVLKMDQ